MLCALSLFTACSDDRDSNPTLTEPTSFVLNEPAAKNVKIDLANSTTLSLTCSQPNYGFPAVTRYEVYVSPNADMTDSAKLSTTYTTPKLDLDAAEVASDLTTLLLNQGKTEADFPMDLPVYFQVRAYMVNTMGNELAGTSIKSNIVSYNDVHLLFSLPPVTTPDNLYLVGNFCAWDWKKGVTMTPVYDHPNVFWHMVYIDEKGVKFNSAQSWDGNEVGFAGITVDPSGDLAGEIKDSGDGNIASSNPGWYLMIVYTSVEGRDVKYNVVFNKPVVNLIGAAVGGWDEGAAGSEFTVPSAADGDFVSPALPALAGNDTDGCVRMYCKIPGNDWWHSEFIVGIDGNKISYRAMGGDQDRVGCSAGQHVYLNFSTDTGKIE